MAVKACLESRLLTNDLLSCILLIGLGKVIDTHIISCLVKVLDGQDSNQIF